MKGTLYLRHQIELQLIKQRPNKMSGLYNLVNQIDPSVVFFLPLVDETIESIPRFRDAFPNKREFRVKDGFPIMTDVEEADKEGFEITHVYVLTRVGGGNRAEYHEEIERLRKNPHYVNDEDDSFDSTYALFKFKIPEKWLPDVKVIQQGKDPCNTSKEYQQKVIKAFPQHEETLLKLFAKEYDIDESKLKMLTEIGNIEGEKAMYLREHQCSAQVIGERKSGEKIDITLELSLRADNGLPLVRNELSGEFYTIEWDDIVKLAIMKGLCHEEKPKS